MGHSKQIIMKAMKVAIAFAIFGLTLGSSTYPPRTSRATTCGNFPSFMTGDRIVGGVAASSPIPWQVSVRNGQSGWGHFCGGTILDEKNCNVCCSLLYQGPKHEWILHCCWNY